MTTKWQVHVPGTVAPPGGVALPARQGCRNDRWALSSLNLRAFARQVLRMSTRDSLEKQQQGYQQKRDFSDGSVAWKRGGDAPPRQAKHWR